MTRLFAILVSTALATQALAQQNQCRTSSPGADTAYCASEAFVTKSIQAVPPGGTVTSVNCGTGLTGGTITTTGTCAADEATASDIYSAAVNKQISAGAMYTAEVTVTFSSTPTFDFSTFINAVITLTGNISAVTVSNLKAGQAGQIRFIQDGSGSRTLPATFNSNFKFAGGTQPVLSTVPGAVDIIFYSCVSSSLCYASLSKAFS